MSDNLFNDIENYLNANNNENEYKLLTKDEYESLILIFLRTRGDEGAEEDEVMEIIRWAESVKIQQTMLDLVLGGECTLNWKDNEPVFGLTEVGKLIASQLNTAE